MVDDDKDRDLNFFATAEQGDIWLYTNEDGEHVTMTSTSGLVVLAIEYLGDS